jgi:glycolate oxidase
MNRLDPDEGVRRAYSRDASGSERLPEAVSRPTSTQDVVEVIGEARGRGFSVTAAGAQTSYVGSSITDRGVLMSLLGMNRILDIDEAAGTARVQPGALLGDVKQALGQRGLLFAPDPTSEEESTVGGAIAANASGARSFKYGATRRHIIGLTVVLASGEVVELTRSRVEKNTAGLFPIHDPVDWFVGSEGTLGIVVEATLSLLPLPDSVTGFGFPFASMAAALEFVARARQTRAIQPRCLEFLDDRALAIAREYLGQTTWARQATAFVYAEEESWGRTADMDAWLALAEECGADVDESRVFGTEAELRDARRMRHAVPATMNERAAAFWKLGGRKVSTDWAVPPGRLRDALDSSARIAETHAIERPVTFGHAGNGHPHQNYIARDASELATIHAALEETLRAVIALGGTVAAEHGIGKTKRRYLALQLSPLQRQMMEAMKQALDPDGLLAPGNIF